MSAGPDRTGAFTIDAAADRDEDDLGPIWGDVHPTRGGASLAGELGCTGVWNGVAAASISMVGPRGATFGSAEF